MASIEEYKKRIQEFIYCLVRKDYQAVNNLMLANSVPIQDIRRVIEEYGCTIIPLPVKAFDLALSYQISDKQVDIYIPLWLSLIHILISVRRFSSTSSSGILPALAANFLKK